MYRILLIETGCYLWLSSRHPNRFNAKDCWQSKTDAYLDLISAINEHNSRLQIDPSFVKQQSSDLGREVTFSDFVIVKESHA